jgi:hypothetical protein
MRRKTLETISPFHLKVALIIQGAASMSLRTQATLLHRTGYLSEVFVSSQRRVCFLV